MAEECLFCRIARKEIPAKIVYADEQVIIFQDINPQAPVHLLLIPRRHIPRLRDLSPADAEVVGKIPLYIPLLTKQLGLKEEGIRLVVNDGAEAGQSVFHLHFHLLAGRSFRWPPG